MICLLVIAVKLYHPFDNIQRSVYSRLDLGFLTVEWDAWIKAFKEADSESANRFDYNNMMNVTEQDILGMSGSQTDAYLDWYEKTWIDGGSKERNKRALPDQLLNMFPIGRLDGSIPKEVDVNAKAASRQAAVLQRLLRVQGCLKMRNVVSKVNEGKQKEPINRIGSLYVRYRSVEDLSPQAESFYKEVASLSGLSLVTLVRSVFRMELKLQKYKEEEMKEESESSNGDESVAD